MVQVIEYGEDIGTLKNLFRDEQAAIKFVKTIMDDADGEYTQLGPNNWYCATKKEYVKIESI